MLRDIAYFGVLAAALAFLFIPPAPSAQLEATALAPSVFVKNPKTQLQQKRMHSERETEESDLLLAQSVPLPPARPAHAAPSKQEMLPASELFSAVQTPSRGTPQAIGYYPRGCLAGAEELPLIGPNWQVMRVSRNRNWGHPELVRFIKRLASNAPAKISWPGILVGDMSQPRGGPLPSGHASHQIGLDVDIWLRPMPAQPFSSGETDTVPMTSVVASDGAHLDPSAWTTSDFSLIKVAAQDRDVERIFVSPMIKKELCRIERPQDRNWMEKVRPWYGHRDHIHVRLKCPPGSPQCRPQQSVRPGDGCGKLLDEWFSKRLREIDNKISSRAPLERTHPLLSELPKTCVAVLHAPGRPIFARQIDP
jgi:penicillin-insensitive murein endopeptidase